MGSRPLDEAALAAVDLGSNSFHLVVAREIDGRPHVIDKLRVRVGLAEGLSGRTLDGAAQQRAFEALEMFRERLAAVPRDRIRAVGTATFRRVRDGEAFLRRSSECLGAQIEVLPGREEARLVYLGVAHALGDDEGRRFVVDIGGGSTECMLGTRFISERGDSLGMGCVTWTKRFFPGGRVTQESMSAAVLAARMEIEPVSHLYGAGEWDHAIGSSGTIRSVAAILEGLGLGDGTITRGGLKRLRSRLVELGKSDRFEFEGLRADRRDVLAGGVAILRAVFKELGVEQMTPSTGALREGALHDLLGRIHHEDVREASAVAFMERLGLDTSHGMRCRETVEGLFDQVAASLSLSGSDRQLLGWSALLHTIGFAVSHSGYHKHGAYLAEHADLAGFSRQDRHQVSTLIRGQRRRLRPDQLAGFSGDRVHALRCLITILRIGLRLRRDRTGREIPDVRLAASGSRYRLRFPKGWLDDHPLTRADLAQESDQLETFGVVLDCV